MAAIPVTGKIIGTNAEQQKNKSDFTVDELVHAAQHGDFPFIETAVEGYNISASLLDSDGCSLMHWACINNRLKIAQFLLGKNIDINYAGGANNETALQWAVRNPGGTELVGFLLAQCQDINIAHKSKYGLDALFIAVQTGNFDIVYLLLVAGADPNTLSNDKDSPLLWLLKTKTDVPRSTDLLRLLLSFQADASKGDRDKNTGLHVLASGSNLKLPFLLFQKGADLDARNNEYLTPSDLAKSAQNYEMQLVLKDIANFVKLPLNFPIFLFAMCFIVWVLSWHFFDWYYVIFLIFPMSLLIFQRFSQRRIELKDSRLICGFSWGLTLSIVFHHIVNVSSFVTSASSLMVYIVAILTCYYLYMAMVTVPAGVMPHDPQSRVNLAEKLVRSWGKQSSTSQVAESSVALDEATTSIQICPSCLVDKVEASTHCSQCDRCILAMDHHCPFVNNCVGKGNRKYFVLFCLFGALGCALGTVFPFQVQYNHYCVGEQVVTHAAGWSASFATFFRVQMCVVHMDLTLFIMPYIAGLCSVWIFGLFAQQIFMVMTETTTYESMILRKRNGLSPVSARAVRNLITFFSTGQYIVTIGKKQLSSCCDHDHAVGEPHVHGKKKPDGSNANSNAVLAAATNDAAGDCCSNNKVPALGGDDEDIEAALHQHTHHSSGNHSSEVTPLLRL